MATDKDEFTHDTTSKIPLSDEDLFQAMKEVGGYLDITSADLKELYLHAYRHALQRIISSSKALDVMSSPAFSVKHNAPLQEVAELMGSKGISGVPVVDDSNSVVGIISEKDFLRRMGGTDKAHFMSLIAACLRGGACVVSTMKARTAQEIMASPAITVTPDTTVYEIIRIFSDRKINRVPVTDSAGTLLGIVSRADVLGVPFRASKEETH